ncbi:beta strand repeat-containing protein, partial [Thioalkalivibrio sp. HK1]|uniref:beta strand repeat-containing protein n=1 Tax=Thioalkalivibrio sp. HK1 TaxID=1469245 RepID=UPI0012DC437C
MKKIPTILFAIALGLMLADSAWAQQKSFVISEDDLNLTEGGMFSFSMRLSSQPTGDVTVTVEPAQSALLEVNTSIITNGVQNSNANKTSTLTFTTSNWNEDQTVTLFSIRDSNSDDESTQVNLSASGGGFDAATGKVMVSVMDADAGGLVISKQWLGYVLYDGNSFIAAFHTQEIAEQFREAIRTDNLAASSEIVFNRSKTSAHQGRYEFTVKLASQPKAGTKTTVEAISDNPAWIKVTPKVLEWTPEQWNQTKTFTIARSLNHSIAGQQQQQGDHVGQISLVRRIKDDDAQGSDQGVYQGTGIVDIDIIDWRQAAGGVTLLSTSANLSPGSVGTAALSMVGKNNPFGDWIEIEASIPNEDKSRLDIVGTKKRIYYRQNDNHHLFQNFKFRAKEDADIDNNIAQVRFDVEEQQDGESQYRAAKPIVYVYIEDRTIPSLRIARNAPTDHPGNPVETSTATIKVKLSAPPAMTTLGGIPGKTFVSVESADTSLLTISPATLEFTRDNWNQDQTLTLTGVDDIDALNEAVKVTFVAKDGRFDEASGGPVDVKATETISVFDDDARFVLSKSTLSIGEGGNDTFMVKLKGRPSGNVDAALSSSDIGAMTFSPAKLTFTNSNWNTDQTVTVNGVQDFDATDERVSLNLLASGAQEFVGKQATATIDIDDDESVGLEIDPATGLSVAEGRSKSFTVELTSKPTGAVTVSVSQTGTANDDISASPASLSFTALNWDQPQTVTVSAAQDDDASDESTNFELNASGADYENVSGNVAVRVDDDDMPGLTLSLDDIGVTEGSSNSFTVKLDTKPSDDVTVNLAQPADTTNDDISISAVSLTFTSSNWNVEQTVTVSAAEDDDTEADSTTVKLSASGADYGNVSKDLAVRVTDNDNPGLTLSSTDIDVNEGSTNTFTVALATQPSGTVTVALAQSDPANADVTVDNASLTFTTSDWGTAQTVTVRAAHDDDASNESATFKLNASGADYNDISVDVDIDVTDDDEIGLNLPSNAVALTEQGTATFDVTLTARPSANVTVTLTQPTNTDVELDTDANEDGNQTTLIFTPSNWNTAQTVTVSAAGDFDTSNENASIPVSASGGGYDSATGTVNVRVTDDDAGVLTLPSAAVTVTEGSTATFDVRLSAEPTANVTVTLTQPTNTDASLNKISLIFTSTNWNTAQTVTVSAAEDGDTTNESTSISLSATGGGYHDAVGTVSIEITDDDAGSLTLPSNNVALTEGQTTTFDVRLSAQPSANVTVTLTQPTDNDVKLDTDANETGNQTTLIFTASNWNVARSVTLSAAEDFDTADETTSISVSASGGGYGDARGTVGIDLTDDDAGHLTLPSAAVVIVEGGTATFDVKLTAPPSATVTLTLPQPDNTDITLDTDSVASGNQTTLTFTTSNWNTAQTVTVNAAEDADTANESATISVSASGGGYDDATGTVGIALTDNDGGAALVLPTQPVALTEGSTTTFDVKLTERPSGDVTVTLTQPTSPDISLDTDTVAGGDQTTLTFTTSNWNMVQRVELSAAEDFDTTDESETISVSASGGGYDSARGTVSIALTDDDAGSLNLPSAAVVIVEGGTATFDVKLTARPSATVTLTLRQPDNTDIKLDTDSGASGNQTTLLFTTSNWNSAQRVTVSAAEDPDTANESASISVSASGGGYGDATGTVGIALTDNDGGAALVLPTQSVALTEGSTATFDVKLTERPSGDVTVTLTQPTNPDIGLDTDTVADGEQTTLTFTTSNWNAAQRVTLSAAEDGDTTDESETISVSASGGGYDSARGTVSIALTDDDAGLLTLPPAAVALDEGGTATFDVRLSARPTGSVTVTLAQPSNGDV